MPNGPTTRRRRAMVIAVCSGKGGIGKSTLAIFIASRLASASRNTLLIDADFGIGDIATMTNQTPVVGFEQILAGTAELEGGIVPLGPCLSVIGTLPGSHIEASSISDQALTECRKLGSQYDVIVIDTPSTIDPLNLNLIAGSDLCLSVVTSRIPAIADSYVQLKRILQIGKKTELAFIVNQVDSEAEGSQTVAKFGELIDRFLGRSIPALGIVETVPRITKAAESQSLLELTREPAGFGRKAEKMIKTLMEKHIDKPLTNCAIWEHLATTIFLKSEVSFDDTRLLAGV